MTRTHSRRARPAAGRVAVLVLLAACASATRAHAQRDTLRFAPLRLPGWVGTTSLLSANALLGGTTAGVVQRLRGGSFRDGFARGALGGALGFAGKRVAVEPFPGAGLLGREVTALGASVARNAADARPTLDRLILPIGPVWLYLEPARRRVQARLDAVAAGWILYGILEDELDFAGSASLSAGTPVFRTREKLLHVGRTQEAYGVVNAGVVLLADVRRMGAATLRHNFEHERVHVLQADAVFLTWTDPIESALLGKFAVGRALGRWVDINVSTELLRALGEAFPEHGDRPWEIEAEYLARK